MSLSSVPRAVLASRYVWALLIRQLSLLLKLNPLVSDLRLYDIRLAPGVAADIDHINTASKVCCHR